MRIRVSLRKVVPKSDAHEQISRGLTVSALTPKPLTPTFAFSPGTVFSAVLRLGSNPANANNQGSPGATGRNLLRTLGFEPSGTIPNEETWCPIPVRLAAHMHLKPLPRNMNVQRYPGRRKARADYYARSYQNREDVLYVDAAVCPLEGTATAAAMTEDARIIISASVKTARTDVAEGVALALAVAHAAADSTITEICTDSQTESNVRVKVLTSDPSEATTMTRTGSQRGLSKSARRQRRLSEETEAITKLREMSMQQPQHEATTSRVAAPGVLFPVKVLAVLVPAVLIAFLTISRLRSKPIVRTERFCTSRGCIEHAVTIGLSELAKRPNKSVPCEDFGQFICSVWEARHRQRYGRRHLTKSVVTDAIMDHIISLEKFSGQQHALTISERPARMMDACLRRRPSDDTDVLKQLLYFMRNTGFGFPADSVALGDYSLPLKALTELAYRWALPLWFYVDLVLPHNGTVAKRIVSLSHSALGDIYDAFNDALMEYQDIYPLYAAILTETIYNGSVDESFQAFTRECKSMQKHVFSNLSRVARRRLHHPILVKIKSLPSFVVNTTVDHWLRALRPLWSVSPSISGKDGMYFTDREMLVAINTLFNAYTARDIYLHVHWWFVQFLGAVASNQLFDSLKRDAEHGLSLQKILCSVHVTSNYNFILASEQGARLGSWKRAEVGTHLNKVHAVAVSKVSSAVSVQLANLLEHMQPVIWPREPYASEDGLVRLFGNATSGDEDASFIELWLARAASYQRSRASLDELTADATVFRLDSVAAVSHNVVANAVSLSLAVLKAPFYYPEATSAIVYGGLGFIYAAELVRLLNSFSLLLNNRDTIVPSETFSQSYVWLSLACLGMSTQELFPFYMALELAYSTYRKHRSDVEDVRIANAKGFSPDQVFFATACYLMCDMGNGAKLCDVFMKSFPEFGTAFSCPPIYRYSSCDILH
ncbi:hypothetical protein HPB49_019614 [Dermacentor silvarum]|uniref:Uncharacterized protein n=1 Tax=Dermacentor silvarum TaxID=543639 RepID=A0ACB8D7R9_DERSI|nr:hypothetical protein HPB49_019614 [Dermacentor silvarum]